MRRRSTPGGGGRGPGAARRSPAPGEGHRGRRGAPHDVRFVAAGRRPARRARRDVVGGSEGRRRDRRRQDEPARVRVRGASPSNELFGDTRNPWAIDWSPGGSSGGSGRRAGDGAGADRDRHGRRRIDAHPGRVLRARRAEADERGDRPRPACRPGSTCRRRARWPPAIADASLLLDVHAGGPSPVIRPRFLRGPAARARRPSPRPRDAAHADYGPLPEGLQASFDAALRRPRVGPRPPGRARRRRRFPEQLDHDWLLTIGVEELAWIGRDVLEIACDESLHRDVAADARDATRTASTTYIVGAPPALRVRASASTSCWARTRSSCPRRCAGGGVLRGRPPAGGRRSPAPTRRRLQHAGRQHHRPPRAQRAGGHLAQRRAVRPADHRPALRRRPRPRGRREAWEAATPWPLTAPGYQPFGAVSRAHGPRL